MSHAPRRASRARHRHPGHRHAPRNPAQRGATGGAVHPDTRVDGPAQPAVLPIPATPPGARLTLGARAEEARRQLTLPLAVPAIALLLPLFVLPFFGRRRF